MSRRGSAPRGFEAVPVWVMALLVATGCTRSAAIGGSDTDAEVAVAASWAALAEVLEADREFARAVSERGLDARVEAFDGNGSMIVPAGPIATGPEAVRAAMEPAFEDPGFSLVWEPIGGEVSATGDLAFTFGDYETSSNDQLIARGRYVTVWKRGGDGRWRVLADIGNRDRG